MESHEIYFGGISYEKVVIIPLQKMWVLPMVSNFVWGSINSIIVVEVELF